MKSLKNLMNNHSVGGFESELDFMSFSQELKRLGITIQGTISKDMDWTETIVSWDKRGVCQLGTGTHTVHWGEAISSLLTEFPSVMDREEVYKALDSERDYQISRWGDDKLLPNPKRISAYLTWMQHYLSEAQKLVSTSDETFGTETQVEIMNQVRKITTLGVACGETHSMPPREK